MIFLRTLFIASWVGCFVLVVWFARWEGQAVRASHDWIIDLPRSPLWEPPSPPTFEEFRKRFSESESFPVQAEAVRIHRRLRIDRMLIDLVLWLWPVCLGCGFFYWLTRGDECDLVLHLGLWAGMGISAGAASSFLLWLTFGGWGPPWPELFGVGGLIGGIVVGILRPMVKRRRPAPSLVQEKYFGPKFWSDKNDREK